MSPFIVVKGAGEMASAIAWRLYMANLRRICMLDLDQPAVRAPPGVVLHRAGIGRRGRGRRARGGGARLERDRGKRGKRSA